MLTSLTDLDNDVRDFAAIDAADVEGKHVGRRVLVEYVGDIEQAGVRLRLEIAMGAYLIRTDDFTRTQLAGVEAEPLVDFSHSHGTEKKGEDTLGSVIIRPIRLFLVFCII